MRAVAVLALALLTGCSADPAAETPKVAEGGERIACALAGASEFSESCAVDRADVDGTLTLILRHPDGAFRRFAVVRDGRGLIVADGSEQARTAIQGDKLAVSVADDRYLFPARIKSKPADAKP
ncbi:hypothetical protein HNO88_000361 [Novosphingobium chloroacetimidivorans]|uniref:Lipoprotein n=1 Tax=Novosphingobium chloroacetimidivorans TaxID=1428314 RepID=A0A7W7K7A9_9SPHN|nr:hypothetical protein [Novosphingobium chloroacetimidivorans]MBB4857064.1 hypothetical protein [Novosphingobium chloroacetimidivorans]